MKKNELKTILIVHLVGIVMILSYNAIIKTAKNIKEVNMAEKAKKEKKEDAEQEKVFSDVNKYLEKANKFIEKNDFSSAEKTLKEVFKIDSENAAAYRELGKISIDKNIEKNDFSKAIGYLEKAKKINPDDPGVYFQLARVYRFDGSPEKSKDVLEEGLSKIDKKDALYINMLILLSECCLEMNDLKSADKQIKLAAKIDPKNGWLKSVIKKLNEIKKTK